MSRDKPFRNTLGPTACGHTVTNANASGQVTITHGRATAPVAVVAGTRNGGSDVRVFGTPGATTFVLQGYDRASGAAVANGTSLDIDWIAHW